MSILTRGPQQRPFIRCGFPIWIWRIVTEILSAAASSMTIFDPINTLISSDLDTSSQTTLLAQNASGFNAVTSESVMILHGNQHWVTAARTADDVLYMDSLRPHQQITAYAAAALTVVRHLCRRSGTAPHENCSEYTSNQFYRLCIFAAAYAAQIVAGNIRGIQGPFDVGAMRHQPTIWNNV